MDTIFKITYLLLVLSFLYIIFPVPFILTKEFWGSLDFCIVQTVGNAVIIITSVTNNVLLLFVLHRTPQVFGSANYLFMMMVIGDMLYPLFFLPFVITYSWILQERSWRTINIELLLQFARAFTATYYFLATVSITSFKVACVVRLYTTLIKMFDQIECRFKFLLGIVPIMSGAVLFGVNQEYTDISDWSHLLISIWLVFFPITVIIICLAMVWWYRSFREIYNHKKTLNYTGLYAMALLYIVCWLPVFTISSIHIYHERIDFGHYSKLTYILPTLLMIKSPMNLIVLACTDSRLQATLENILFKCCCCCLSQFYHHKRHWRRRRRDELNNNNMGGSQIFYTGSEMQVLNLSGSKIDMYSDSTADLFSGSTSDMKELIEDDLFPQKY